MRYRFYSMWGLSGTDIIKFSLFLSLMYGLGAITLFSISSLTSKQIMGSTIPFAHNIRLLAWTALLCLVVYWLIILSRKKPFIVRGMKISLPGPCLTLAQTVFALTDLVLSSLILYLFLKAHAGITFHFFLTVYIAAQILGLFSQVPGGLGVFEGTFLYMMEDSVPSSSVFAALLVFRVVYYFFPLILAGAGLITYELMQRSKKVEENIHVLIESLSQNIPHIFSILLILSGGLLLVSGSTPTDRGVIKWLYETLPLSVVEASHMVGSIVGVLLLFMARAVRLRIDAAYFGIVLLLSLGAASSLLKGFDWQEASALCFLLILFLPSRRFFYRKSSLMALPLSWTWIGFIGIILIGSLWIGFFSYRHIEYTNDLWWQFAYKGDASRFLRSSLTVAVMVLCYSAYRLLRVKPAQGHLPGKIELNSLEPLVHGANETQSYLALIGDKNILWNHNRKAFLMYGTTRNYWIAMGDPVGSREDIETLVWQFRELADKNGARIAFYQVSKDNLPLYLDLGLVLIKLGEEARVPLQNFDLKGGKRSGLRQTHNKFSKLGLSFSILEKDQVNSRIQELYEVSQSWLETKKTKEKRFSLGFFSQDYISRTRCGVITRDNKILAFANLWESGTREEMSIDLMRYTPDAPGGIMEYLFISLMLWGREQDYRWFNLGMAPLSGLETHPLAPLWHKIGNIIFKYGDNFYNFDGLRAYKDKFDPVWQPRYLAAPALKAPSVLMRVTNIISCGWKGVFV